jgi:hypothetical protein
MLRCLDKQGVFSAESEWVSQQSKVVNELAIVTSEAQEASHLFD